MRTDRGVSFGRSVTQELVGPRYEVFPVRTISMAAVVLPPGELAIEQADVDCRHSFRLVVVRPAQIFCAKQPKHGSSGDSSHETALVIEPIGVAFLRHA